MRQFLLAFTLALAVASVYCEGNAESPKWVTEESAGQEARDKLLDQLFAGYKSYSYPENSTVEFGVALLDVQLDEERNRMNTDAWLRISWIDTRFTWDKEALGITLLRVPSNKVWLPDVTLYNSAQQGERLKCWDSNVLIYSTGKVLWVPPCHLETYCNLTVARSPYKEQLCTLKFGSWTFDGLTMGLDFWQGEKYADVQDYFGRNTKYEITKNTAVKNEKKYDCCVEPYFDLTYTIGLTRHDESVKKCEN